MRAVLTARKLVQSKLLDVENSLRGILRGFGLKVGKTTARSFAGRIQELVTGHPHLETIGEALLSVRAVLQREFNAFEKRVRAMARSNRKNQAVDVDPGGRADRGVHLCLPRSTIRRGSNRPKQAGSHFGLTPKKYQSGETDHSGRISKIGDASVREALYQAAHVMLTKPVKGCSQLKSWAMRIARRAGMKQGQGRAGAQTRRDLAPHARQRNSHSTPAAAAA